MTAITGAVPQSNAPATVGATRGIACCFDWLRHWGSKPVRTHRSTAGSTLRVRCGARGLLTAWLLMITAALGAGEALEVRYQTLLASDQPQLVLGDLERLLADLPPAQLPRYLEHLRGRPIGPTLASSLLDHPSVETRVAALNALGFCRPDDESQLSTVRQTLNDVEPAVVKAGIATTAVLGDEGAIHQLVALTTNYDRSIAAAAVEALRVITNTNRGNDPSEWQTWWTRTDADALSRLEALPARLGPDVELADRLSAINEALLLRLHAGEVALLLEPLTEDANPDVAHLAGAGIRSLRGPLAAIIAQRLPPPDLTRPQPILPSADSVESADSAPAAGGSIWPWLIGLLVLAGLGAVVVKTLRPPQRRTKSHR